MRSQLDGETDDEYLDDPIRLFDLEQEEVYYGSQSMQNGNSFNDAYCQSRSILTSTSDAELLELPDNDSEELTESDCIPLSIKLVDCEKFPWYFKKYTQQILDKANIFDLVSDSDSEVDVEHFSDNNDCCVISRNINSTFKDKNENSKIDFSSVNLSELINQSKAEKRQETMKQRDAFEIQIALYRKNREEVDFKRNKGLIGMTITQKVLKHVELDDTIHQNIKVKRKSKKQTVVPDQSYISAAEKILSDVGTELLHVCDETQKPVTTIGKGTYGNRNLKDEILKSGDYAKAPLQFNLRKISENILRRISKNKLSDKIQDDNKQERMESDVTQDIDLDPSLELSSSSNEIKSSSKHVKNIKKTNKYKNNHVKAIEKMILEKEALELNKEKIGRDNAVKFGSDTDFTQSPHKVVKADLCERNSSILHCSDLAKKNSDIKEISKSDTTTYYFGNKQKAADRSNGTENKSKATHQVINKNMMPELTRELQKTCIKFHQSNEETEHVIQSRQITEVAFEKNNEIGDNILTKHKQAQESAERRIVQDFVATSQDNSDNLSIQIVSVESVAPSIRTTNANFASIDKTTPQSDVESTIQSKPVTEINDHNSVNHYSNGVEPNSSVGNDSVVGSTVNDLRNNTNKSNVNNPYASAIILKSNQPSISHNTVRYSQSIFNEPPRTSVSNQPRLYQHSYSSNYRTLPPHSGIDQISANSTIPNYRFPPLHESRHQTHYKQAQVQHFFNGRKHPNMSSKKTPKGAWSRKSLPCKFPVKILQSRRATDFGTSYRPENNLQPQSSSQPDIPQPYNIPQPKNMPQPKKTIQLNDIPQPNNVSPPKNTLQQNTPQPKPQPSNILQPKNIPQANNVSQPDNCSVIGSNNDGLVKKIKIDSKSLSLDTGKQIDELNSNSCVLEVNNDNPELITSKNSMLEILDSATNSLKRAATDVTEVNKKSVQAFKRPRVAYNQQIIPKDDNYKKKDRLKGYSDPILPIPTYEKMMGRVVSDSQKKEEPRSNNVCHRNLDNDRKYNEKLHKRAFTHKSNGTAKKEDIKKISLEEYKKRTAKKAHKTGSSNEKVCEKKNTYDRKLLYINGQNTLRGNVDRCSTESDLGYDSDSTVIL